MTGKEKSTFGLAMRILNRTEKPEPTTWESRKRTDFHTQSGTDGGSIEHMIHLANRLGANPWFNLPHAADDNYVRHFASLVKSTLRPDLKVYVEYSNEAWNGIFRQTAYCKEQGMKLHLDILDWKAGMIFYGKRGAEIADIWNGVFGANKDQVIPVFAWQTGYRDYYRQAVEALGQNLHKFKAFAITGYIECQSIAGTHKVQMVQMSMAEIQQFCMNDIPNYESDFKYYMDLALSHGVKLLMYEGGPGIVESGAIEHGVSNNDVTAKAIAFNHDPLMEPVVHDVLVLWDRTVARNASNGFPGGLFNYFSYTGKPSKYGSWGMLEYTGQDPETVPKFRGTQRYISETFAQNPLGPKCTFVKDGSTSYGCFATSSSGQFKCGTTTDGNQWTYFSSLNQSQGDYMVLDGYDKVKGILYIRVTDHYGANSYHTIEAKQHAHWDTISDTWDYYRALASRHSLRSLPPGVYAGLHVPVKCT
ncbi:hypothetical protein CHS0354_012255 [Potamilus streckersoni]|uniref:Uncharacterized protein n=1 Tax=Potamilus streckersoni TaxID=2493646 RepID=A0AAE0VRR4_9BIVA|nr:hypothetical protein CHS0354_012255 [Potamilus streckersoni]